MALAKARLQDELAYQAGWHRITAFLDGSRRDERAGHQQATQAAVSGGPPPRIANLVWGLYGGPRRVRVHRAVGEECRPASGLVAGCPAAKDVLEAYLKPVANVVQQRRVRQSVDDFMLSVEGDDTSAGGGGPHGRRHPRGQGSPAPCTLR